MTSKDRLLKVADYLEKSAAPDIADEIRKCLPDLDLLETILKNSTIYVNSQNDEIKLKCELTIDDKNYKYGFIIDDEIKRRENAKN